MEWFVKCWRQSFDAKDRARRAEYWWFFLIQAVILLACILIDNQIGTYDGENDIGLLEGLYALVSLPAGISVSIRRLHDVGKSGWWLLIGLVPIVGLVLFVWYVREGEPIVNQWGENPKLRAATA
jgi:uncharacterized membrane protein YhaH (DUF805 family)